MKRFVNGSVLVDSETNEPVKIAPGSVLLDPSEFNRLLKARDVALAVEEYILADKLAENTTIFENEDSNLPIREVIE